MARQGKRVGSEGMTEAALRQFVADLLRGGAERMGPVPPALVVLAQRVLEGVPAARDVEPEDLVQELLERLVWRQRRQGEQALEELLAVDSLQSVLRVRLRQLASEKVPGRAARKELRSHVARALEAPGAHGPAQRPDALEVDGRYRSAAVHQGVTWALEAEGLPAEVNVLVDFLAREYALGVAHVDSVHAEARPDEDALPADAALLARELSTQLGEQGAHLVGLHLDGATLKELCAATGRKQTSLHTEVGALREQLVEYVRSTDAEAHQVRGALRMLASAAVTGPRAEPQAAPSKRGSPQRAVRRAQTPVSLAG